MKIEPPSKRCIYNYIIELSQGESIIWPIWDTALSMHNLAVIVQFYILVLLITMQLGAEQWIA